MPISFNGTVPTSIIYNGTSLDKVIYNGTVVWTKATPYTVGDFTKYTWTFDTPAGTYCEWDNYVSATQIYLKALMTDETQIAEARYRATFSTQGCNRLRVKYAYYNNVGQTSKIGGQSISSHCDLLNQQYLYIPISGDSYELSIICYNGSSYAATEIYVTELYFYNE